MIHEYNGAVVLHVPDNSANRLVHSSCSLLRVPLGAGQSNLIHLVLLLEILFLQNDDWIGHLWIRNSYEKHASSCIIRKVKAF